MYEVETIQLDETNRLVVSYDDPTDDDPRDWGWDVAVHELNYKYTIEAENVNGDEAVAMFNDVYDRTGDKAKALRAMQLWMVLVDDERYGDIHYISADRHEYQYIVLAEDKDTADAFMGVFARWTRGEVYNVAHETMVVWVNLADDTVQRKTWDIHDSIGGCYLDSEYTALDVARDHFNVCIPTEVWYDHK